MGIGRFWKEKGPKKKLGREKKNFFFLLSRYLVEVR